MAAKNQRRFWHDQMLPGEQVLLSPAWHPAPFLIPTLVSDLIGLAAVLLGLDLDRQAGTWGSLGGNLFRIFSCLLMLQAIFFFFQAFITLGTTGFAVTSRRVLGRTGFLRKRRLDAHLAKVANITVKPYGPRWLRSGTVTVTLKDGRVETFWPVLDPWDVQAKLAAIFGTAA